ncbi:MAG: serine/threonine-protein phosphatase [Nitrospirae bacterium]|nr:serine/threonine-protein phosphatase [Nitrospirota bacterium]
MQTWTLDFGNEQDRGKRREQEDYFASFSPVQEVVNSEGGFLAVVADGMGGHTSGAKASVLAVNAFVEEYKRKRADQSIADALSSALRSANQRLVSANLSSGQDSDMGTTLVAAVIRSNKLSWVSVGDSRLFLYRGGQLLDINENHSYGAELDAKKKLSQISTEELEAGKKNRGMLTSYLGLEDIPQIDISNQPIELYPNERVLICTDGLTDALTKNEITMLLKSSNSAQETCETLIQHALDKNLYKQDNITIILLELKLNDKPQTVDGATVSLSMLDITSFDDYEKTVKLTTPIIIRKRPSLKIILGIILIVLAVAAFGLYLLH